MSGDCEIRTDVNRQKSYCRSRYPRSLSRMHSIAASIRGPLVCRNRTLMLQGQADVIEPFEQALTDKCIDWEWCGKFPAITYPACFKIHSDFVSFDLIAARYKSFHLVFGQLRQHQPILLAVGSKDIGERWCDDGAKAVIHQSPGGMLARRTAPEVAPCDQNGSSLMAWFVEGEIRDRRSIWLPSPIMKKELTEA